MSQYEAYILGYIYVKKSGNIWRLGNKVCMFMRASSYALLYSSDKLDKEPEKLMELFHKK